MLLLKKAIKSIRGRRTSFYPKNIVPLNLLRNNKAIPKLSQKKKFSIQNSQKTRKS